MLRVVSRLTDGAAAACGGEGMSFLSAMTPALVGDQKHPIKAAELLRL